MDPSVAEINREFPAWQIWRGVNDMWYGRRLRSSPPVVRRDENLTELRAQMRSWARLHQPALQQRPGAARERRHPRA